MPEQQKKFTSKIENYLSLLKNSLDNLDRNDLISFMQTLLQARDEGRQIFIMGNGGSAATASHFVCDFIKGAYAEGDKRFKFFCLNDNVPSMMAYANDVSYDNIFVEQLKIFICKGDLVIGISGSGNSLNVVKAIEYANSVEANTYCLVGYDGGILKKISHKTIHVNVDNMQIVEDIHMVIGHIGMTIFRKH